MGCASSLASGGGSDGCARGAASALIGKWVTNTTAQWGVGIAQFTAATVAGGVTSRMMGGSFESGAMTAAFGYLFNQVATRENHRYINARPGGIDGPTITFVNDTSGGLTTDQLVSPRVADIIEKTVVECSCDININSTTGGHATSPTSLHNGGFGVDINKVNGISIEGNSNQSTITKFLSYLTVNASSMGARELFSPQTLLRFDTNGSAMYLNNPTLSRGHRHHIHVSVPR